LGSHQVYFPTRVKALGAARKQHGPAFSAAIDPECGEIQAKLPFLKKKETACLPIRRKRNGGA